MYFIHKMLTYLLAYNFRRQNTVVTRLLSYQSLMQSLKVMPQKRMCNCQHLPWRIHVSELLCTNGFLKYCCTVYILKNANAKEKVTIKAWFAHFSNMWFNKSCDSTKSQPSSHTHTDPQKQLIIFWLGICTQHWLWTCWCRNKVNTRPKRGTHAAMGEPYWHDTEVEMMMRWDVQYYRDQAC